MTEDARRQAYPRNSMNGYNAIEDNNPDTFSLFASPIDISLAAIAESRPTVACQVVPFTSSSPGLETLTTRPGAHWQIYSGRGYFDESCTRHHVSQVQRCPRILEWLQGLEVIFRPPSEAVVLIRRSGWSAKPIEIGVRADLGSDRAYRQ